jgi:hypothetical protein
MVKLIKLIETEFMGQTDPSNYFGPEINKYGVVIDNRDEVTHTPETDAERKKRDKEEEDLLDPTVGPTGEVKTKKKKKKKNGEESEEEDDKEKVEESAESDIELEALLMDPEIRELLKKFLEGVQSPIGEDYETMVRTLASDLLETAVTHEGEVEPISSDALRELNKFPKPDMEKGISTEMEHTTNRRVAMRIALDHLKEDPHYYQKLDAVEGKKPYDSGMF